MGKHEERFSKRERLCSKKLIDTLFGPGRSHAMTAFPLKVVYRLVDNVTETTASAGAVTETNVQVLISVPKKHFKRAVKRNRVKRQVREAYRKHKSYVTLRVKELTDKQLLIAFIWLSNELTDSVTVDQRVYNLLQRIGERI
ncbi:ribonuclease P protein component [Prevotella scopos JCM 17725]|uniref:Ribonuclease P protein component n=1 Tax=Prevotella scopos JCM 17725 TaxID=1236518 RepID=A0AAX2F464_9BACT|nr:ribonuclease P protein component [Prevotella scopos]ANR72330.1 ribonuclease P protein component [Prevotella scopos JCM 17725]QUB45464.1 ribonuclease P protein component [Prevotella scopos JCM 17725]SHF87588.1 ribonuclease P protein component [Prevotella scopos JCM 17725]